MNVRHVTMLHRDLAVRALRGAPSGEGPYDGILLVHDAWGLDEDVAELAGSIAGAGFVVLAPDLVGGRRAADADEARALAAGLDAEDAALLLATAADALADDPTTRPGRVGVVGLGMGAPLAAFLATIRPEITVAVLAGPVPDLPLESWAQAEAAIVLLEAALPAADEADVADPAVPLDRARAAGRRVEVVVAPGDEERARLTPLILRVLAAWRGAG